MHTNLSKIKHIHHLGVEGASTVDRQGLLRVMSLHKGDQATPSIHFNLPLALVALCLECPLRRSLRGWYLPVRVYLELTPHIVYSVPLLQFPPEEDQVPLLKGEWCTPLPPHPSLLTSIRRVVRRMWWTWLISREVFHWRSWQRGYAASASHSHVTLSSNYWTGTCTLVHLLYCNEMSIVYTCINITCIYAFI